MKTFFLLCFGAAISLVSCDDCAMLCAMVFDPVCGTDGNTYSNECVMKAEVCRARTSVQVQYKGECTMEAQADAAPEIDEECLIMCPLNYDPICGSDGNTYSNDCDMETKACVLKKEIRKVHQGACAEVPAAAPVPESEDCPTMCPMNWLPLCGSDGNTYANECEMKAKACLFNRSITKAHNGACENSQEACEERPCPREYDPVCASDGQTYNNECLMENAACRMKIQLEISHTGAC